MVRPDNPNQAARQQKIPVIPRAEMLGELMRPGSPLPAGAWHTTTTSLVSTLLAQAGRIRPSSSAAACSPWGRSQAGAGQYLRPRR
jgi:UDP-N-acetylmuramate--alanine ligase